MVVKLVDRNNIGEYVIEGRIDSSCADELQGIILDSCVQYKKIILNFSRLQYISSAGLRVLKKLHTFTVSHDMEMVLTNISPLVMEVLEMTGFAQILNIE